MAKAISCPSNIGYVSLLPIFFSIKKCLLSGWYRILVNCLMSATDHNLLCLPNKSLWCCLFWRPMGRLDQSRFLYLDPWYFDDVDRIIQFTMKEPDSGSSKNILKFDKWRKLRQKMTNGRYCYYSDFIETAYIYIYICSIGFKFTC